VPLLIWIRPIHGLIGLRSGFAGLKGFSGLIDRIKGLQYLDRMIGVLGDVEVTHEKHKEK
jgi:hypothetical protein